VGRWKSDFHTNIAAIGQDAAVAVPGDVQAQVVREAAAPQLDE